MIPLSHYLILGAALFALSMVGIFLNRKNVVILLMAIELLLLAVNNGGQREFAGYLKQLNERLAAFIQTLSEAHEGYGASAQSARNFNQQLQDQVTDLQNSVQEAVDLDALKQALMAIVVETLAPEVATPNALELVLRVVASAIVGVGALSLNQRAQRRFRLWRLTRR